MDFRSNKNPAYSKNLLLWFVAWLFSFVLIIRPSYRSCNLPAYFQADRFSEFEFIRSLIST